MLHSLDRQAAELNVEQEQAIIKMNKWYNISYSA